MELTRADGVGGGRYVTTPSGADNADYTAHNFTSPNLFTWSRAEGGMPPSPEPEASLTLSSPDGRYAIQVWTGSDLVCCTDSGETYWLQAESTGQDVFFSGSIFQHLRFWYDEVELAALQGDVVIPDTGQDHLAIAQAWVDAMQAVHLQVTPGSKYALTYVRNVVTLEEDALDSWYQPFMLETEHFYFSYVRIFVPENEVSLGWNMAGNTGEYDGSYGEAPEGAMMNWQMGPMYRTDEGWRCDGTGTRPLIPWKTNGSPGSALRFQGIFAQYSSGYPNKNMPRQVPSSAAERPGMVACAFRAAKVSALMTCSIRQASSAATAGDTPSCSSHCVSRVCRS